VYTYANSPYPQLEQGDMSRSAVLVANLINMHAFIQINQSQTTTGPFEGGEGGSLNGEDKSSAASSLHFPPPLIISTPPFTVHLVAYKFQLPSPEHTYNHPHTQATLFGDFINVRLTIMSLVYGSTPRGVFWLSWAN